MTRALPLLLAPPVVAIQGMQMFTVMRRNGVPAEMIVFPDEWHWVLEANNSRYWHEAVFGWLKRYLGTGQGAALQIR